MRLFLVVAVVALALVWALSCNGDAEAHPGYNRPLDYYAAKMEMRINNYRLSQGGSYLTSTIAGNLANIAISTANYREGRWTTSINSTPFQIWNNAFFGNRPSALLKTIRCRGLPFTPRQALFKLLHGNAWKLNGAVIRHGRWLFLDVRAMSVHKHHGWYSGRGRCTAYYVMLTAL